VDVVILGSGSPLPDPERAGPSTLVNHAGGATLVDCGRGVVMRLAGAGNIPVLLGHQLITHLHSDHVWSFNDVLTTRWVMQQAPGPLPVVGPVGTADFVEKTLASMAHDITYRLDHHDDLTWEPQVDVREVGDGDVVELGNDVTATVAIVDHGVVKPALSYRFQEGGSSAVLAGDTIPCEGLDRLCEGADVYVQTVIREDLVRLVPNQRFVDICDYHSTVEQAAQTAAKGGVRTLVLNHMVPAPVADSDAEAEWVAMAKEHFDGEIVAARDLTRIDA
jgi:ribonuclease Z